MNPVAGFILEKWFPETDIKRLLTQALDFYGTY